MTHHYYFAADDHRNRVTNLVIADLPAEAGQKKSTDTTWFTNQAYEKKCYVPPSEPTNLMFLPSFSNTL